MSGTLITSLDFELFWGMLDVCPFKDYEKNVRGGIEAIPRLLNLMEKYGIHATWAAVGFLFAESYEELTAYFPPEELRPTYDKPGLSPYVYFPKIESKNTPCFYAPSLIRQVSQAPGQEIGSHTFSHYYCREPGQTPQQFAADMQSAKAIASAHGYDLKSAILPRNETKPDYTKILVDAGFTAYRDEEHDWIHKHIKYFPLLRLLRLVDVYLPITGMGGYVPKKEDGIWDFTGSRMMKPIRRSLRFLEPLKLLRTKAQMRHAAKNGLTFHLWWHPHNMGANTEAYFAQLEEIFRYYETLKEKYAMVSLNMHEAAEAAEHPGT